MAVDNNEVEYRLSTSFHRTFSLNRDSIKQIMALIVENGEEQLTNKDIAERTNLGSVYVEAMPRYGFGSGLLTKDRKATDFGKYAFRYDRQFQFLSTQWLMHFYLSASKGPGPEFWNLLVTEFFRVDTSFSDNDLLNSMKDRITDVKLDVLSEAKTAFIGTYTKPDGLGSLSLLQIEGNGVFCINYPEPPSVWVMAVALLHYWQTVFPGQRMVALKDLLDESDFARIFMVGSRRVNKMLEAMRQIGYVELFTSAPPYSVVLLNTDPVPLLERMYTGDETE